MGHSLCCSGEGCGRFNTNFDNLKWKEILNIISRSIFWKLSGELVPRLLFETHANWQFYKYQIRRRIFVVHSPVHPLVYPYSLKYIINRLYRETKSFQRWNYLQCKMVVVMASLRYVCPFIISLKKKHIMHNIYCTHIQPMICVFYCRNHNCATTGWLRK